MKSDQPTTANAASSSKIPASSYWWVRYGSAIAAVIAGLIAREAITPLVGPTALPFISFFPAVALAAWYARLGPGILSTALSALAADYFFLHQTHTLAIRSSYDAGALLAFISASLFIVTA